MSLISEKARALSVLAYEHDSADARVHLAVARMRIAQQAVSDAIAERDHIAAAIRTLERRIAA